MVLSMKRIEARKSLKAATMRPGFIGGSFSPLLFGEVGGVEGGELTDEEEEGGVALSPPATGGNE